MDSAIRLDVGGDFNNQSLTYSTSSVKSASSSTRTGISQIASIYVGDGLKGQVNDKGKPLTTFTASAGGDTTFAAGRLDNQGGSSYLNTKGDAKLMRSMWVIIPIVLVMPITSLSKANLLTR